MSDVQLGFTPLPPPGEEEEMAGSYGGGDEHGRFITGGRFNNYYYEVRFKNIRGGFNLYMIFFYPIPVGVKKRANFFMARLVWQEMTTRKNIS